jgi:DNA-binding NarL/FixJ family response regulator
MSIKTIQLFVMVRTSLLRRGINQALSLTGDISVIDADDIKELLTRSVYCSPDVALIDIDIPAEAGFLAMRQLKKYWPNAGIIALTSDYDEAKLFQVLKAQASACLHKSTTAEKLIESVRQVADGDHPIKESLVTHPSLADRVFRQFQEYFRQTESRRRLVAQLTPREVEILNYLARGLMNKQIATELGISEQTIKNHVTSILRKLNANARAEAVDVAIREGLIFVN